MKRLLTSGLVLFSINTTTVNAQTIVLKPIADATITESSPTSNQGFTTTLNVKPQPDTSRSLIKFDLTPLIGQITPSDIDSAVVEFSINLNNGQWPDKGKPTLRTVDIIPLVSDWQESKASWNCADAL